MKKYLIIPCIAILMLCSACKKEQPNPPAPTSMVTNALLTFGPTTEPIPSELPFTTKELPIYSIQTDQNELTAVSAMIRADSTPDETVIVSAVVDALADSTYSVKVNSVTKDGSRVIVDFDSSQPPVTMVSSLVEELILDAFAMSIIDNISDCKEVGFSVDGGPYSSAHINMEAGAAYLRR